MILPVSRSTLIVAGLSESHSGKQACWLVTQSRGMFSEKTAEEQHRRVEKKKKVE